MRRLLREPLVHFLGLGALLFLLYGWLQGGVLNAPDEIVVSRGQLQSLKAQFERAWQRPPTSQELQGLVDSWVREEIFYREGLAAGLDRDDPIVRRRVGQKVEFMIDATPTAAPSDGELQAWLDANPDKYAVEARYSLRQVYFNPERHGTKLEAVVAAAQRALAAGARDVGDSTLLPAALTDAAAFEIEGQFGAEFAESLKTMPIGGWQGPVRSAYGVHLVELGSRTAGRPATLDEVRAAVERDLLQARSSAAKEAVYEKLLSKYKIRIESVSTTAATAE